MWPPQPPLSRLPAPKHAAVSPHSIHIPTSIYSRSAAAHLHDVPHTHGHCLITRYSLRQATVFFSPIASARSSQRHGCTHRPHMHQPFIPFCTCTPAAFSETIEASFTTTVTHSYGYTLLLCSLSSPQPRAPVVPDAFPFHAPCIRSRRQLVFCHCILVVTPRSSAVTPLR